MKLSTWYRKYRIVTDPFWDFGYAVQVWRIWLPLWLEIGGSYQTKEQALQKAYKHRFKPRYLEKL